MTEDTVKLREFFERILHERDIKYAERDHAAKEALQAALMAVKEDSAKTAVALQEYKTGANEWRDTVKDLIGRSASREEISQRFSALEEKLSQRAAAIEKEVDSLRESRSKGTGRDDALNMARANAKWIIGLGVTLALWIISRMLGMWGTPGATP